MSRILAVLMALTLAACGSASTAGPKTTNPPLKKEPPKTEEPKEDPDFEQDGSVVKFKKLAFRITMTASPWQGGIDKDDPSSPKIVFMRPDVGAGTVLLIIPVVAKGETAKSIAENQHQLASQDTSLTVTAVVDEGKGRQAFTIDRTVDKTAFRTYLGAIPHPTVPDAFLIAVAQVPADKADAFLKDVRAMLDTVAPL